MKKREVLFFYFVPDTTYETIYAILILNIKMSKKYNVKKSERSVKKI
jgi:hypothetical protein